MSAAGSTLAPDSSPGAGSHAVCPTLDAGALPSTSLSTAGPTLAEAQAQPVQRLLMDPRWQMVEAKLVPRLLPHPYLQLVQGCAGKHGDVNASQGLAEGA